MQSMESTGANMNIMIDSDTPDRSSWRTEFFRTEPAKVSCSSKKERRSLAFQVGKIQGARAVRVSLSYVGRA